MWHKNIFFRASFVAFLSLFCIGTPDTKAAPPPLPVLNSISPARAEVQGGAFNLTLTGSGFANNASVENDGPPIPYTTITRTPLQNPTQITLRVPASYLDRPKKIENITVVNEGSPTRRSNALTFIVSYPRPILNWISPVSTLNAYGAEFDLTLQGDKFFPGVSYIRFNDSPFSTTAAVANDPRNSKTRLTVHIPASALTNTTGSPLQVPVVVINPPDFSEADSLWSAPQQFEITPDPEITSLDPQSMVVGDGTREITINGNYFPDTSLVSMNGINEIIPSSRSRNQITFTIPDSVKSSAGIYDVSLHHPRQSNTVHFNVTAREEEENNGDAKILDNTGKTSDIVTEPESDGNQKPSLAELIYLKAWHGKPVPGNGMGIIISSQLKDVIKELGQNGVVVFSLISLILQ